MSCSPLEVHRSITVVKHLEHCLQGRRDKLYSHGTLVITLVILPSQRYWLLLTTDEDALVVR